jgi:crotonobetainyl-CoA:carnitine CoA-transferase CaiB-like acyl-CoA transferase
MPLGGLRVVDSADERGELCGRVLADLGAEVVLVEPSAGSPARRRPPLHHGQSLSFAFRNANKRGVVGDPLDLVAGADVWVRTGVEGAEAGAAAALERNPALVVVSVTDFGLTGPYRDYASTDMVAFAMGGMMYRSGPAGKPPLVAPGSFAYDVAGVHAALGALLAYAERLRTGEGQHVDVSVVESVANLADWALPGFSRSGTVATRQGSGLIYPIYRCADGFVRMVMPLAPPQWVALRAWLGEPEELAGDEWNDIVHRLRNLAAVEAHITALFAAGTMAGLSTEGQRRGLAVTPLYRPGEVIANEHSRSRGTFVRAEVLPGVEADVASGFFELDGARLGFRTRASRVGEHPAPRWGGRRQRSGLAARERGAGRAGLPLSGLRVLDFGIGAVGVEAGRLLAEYGADVIKVESRTYPDFIRVVQGSDMNPQFASSNRSKRAIGVNLKTDEGVALVRRLAEHADVVIENSATGVMERMGLGYDDLRAVNPRIVMVSSQLMGARGAWAHWSGYGPNTRPFAGLTWLWNHAEDEGAPTGVSTIHPDHLVGRLVALLAVAALIRRAGTGEGAHGEVAQFEGVVGMLGDLLLQESLAPGSVRVAGNDTNPGSPAWGPFPCAGDDEWCVINVRDEDEWARLVGVAGGDDVEAWTRTLPPGEVMERLQAAGVPAGLVVHPRHQVDDPHYRARGFLRHVDQPPIGPLLLEGPAFRGSRLAEPVVAPAPASGQHTREVCCELLGMGDDEITRLVEAGVLEEPAR